VGRARGKNVLWTSPLRGEGHASPIVWEDRVFIATALWPPAVREREKAIPEHHVLCYRTSDGALLWDTTVPRAPGCGPISAAGRAEGTPPHPGDRRRAGLRGLRVLGPRGPRLHRKIVWRNEIIPWTFDVTLGSSPIVHGETVILLCAMAKPADSRVAAFDRSTGKLRWERKLEGTGFATARRRSSR